MSLDFDYQDFVFPDYQLEKQRANDAEQEVIRFKEILAASNNLC